MNTGKCSGLAQAKRRFEVYFPSGIPYRHCHEANSELFYSIKPDERILVETHILAESSDKGRDQFWIMQGGLQKTRGNLKEISEGAAAPGKVSRMADALSYWIEAVKLNLLLFPTEHHFVYILRYIVVFKVELVEQGRRKQ